MWSCRVRNLEWPRYLSALPWNITRTSEVLVLLWPRLVDWPRLMNAAAGREGQLKSWFCLARSKSKARFRMARKNWEYFNNSGQQTKHDRQSWLKVHLFDHIQRSLTGEPNLDLVTSPTSITQPKLPRTWLDDDHHLPCDCLLLPLPLPVWSRFYHFSTLPLCN